MKVVIDGFPKQTVYKGDDLKVLFNGDFSHWPEKYGAEAYFLHRVDLHHGLTQLALEDGTHTKAARLNLASEVIDLDCETGKVTLASGDVFQKDLIVVADGVHVSGHHINPSKRTSFDFDCSIVSLRLQCRQL